MGKEKEDTLFTEEQRFKMTKLIIRNNASQKKMQETSLTVLKERKKKSLLILYELFISGRRNSRCVGLEAAFN